jgi:hypothetical protein
LKEVVFAFLFAFIFHVALFAQVQIMSPLPEPVSNNAVAYALVDGKEYIFSFGGIDSTKTPQGIHLRSYRYSVENDIWEAIPDLPDPRGGKIAAAASTVKNKIYIIGGYHVDPDFSEETSPKVHIYNPDQNQYLDDGSDATIAVDDHVQGVWKDSLIYTVSGWSNVFNTNRVQYYDPFKDQWTQATSVPNPGNYRVFGGAGDISGNTIFYIGGASNWNGTTFPITNGYRKGEIDPDDPTQIDWATSPMDEAMRYRAGSSVMKKGEAIIWVGGSRNTYNFDGVAYDGSGGVPATSSWSSFGENPDSLQTIDESLPMTMDLRAVITTKDDWVYVIGGMKENQKVTNRVYRFKADGLVSNKFFQSADHVSAFPNPAGERLYVQSKESRNFRLLNLNGEVVRQGKCLGRTIIDTSALNPGMYFLETTGDKASRQVRKIVIHNL